MSNTFSLSVHELVNQIKDGKTSSVELCQKYIERINKFEKDIKAWAHFDKKLLLEKAEEADKYRVSGKPLGPLHGIPVALKDIIGTIDNPISKVLNLRGVYYKENQTAKDLGYDNDRTQVGVIAQDVEKVLPEAVTNAPIDDKYKTVWYEKLVPLLIEAVKEQQVMIEDLKSRVEYLEVS